MPLITILIWLLFQSNTCQPQEACNENYCFNNSEFMQKDLDLNRKISDSKSNILFVTAFKDIHRNLWKHFERSNDKYLTYFLRLANNIDYNLIVYVEDHILKQLSLVEQFKPNIIFKNLTLVDTFLDKHLTRDKLIMSSSIYKNKIPNNRKYHPEHIYSEYNLATHSKINFVSNAKKMYPNYKFYSWIDFGYSRFKNVPKNINISSLPEKKIIYHCFRMPNKRINANIRLKSFVEYFDGGAFIVDNNLVEKMEKLWEKKIIEWQNNYISDDDQNLILQIYYDQPQLFHLIQNKNWFSLFDDLPKAHASLGLKREKNEEESLDDEKQKPQRIIQQEALITDVFSSSKVNSKGNVINDDITLNAPQYVIVILLVIVVVQCWLNNNIRIKMNKVLSKLEINDM